MALEDIPADSGVIVSNIVLSLQGILLKDPFLIFIVFYYIIKNFLTQVKATTRSYFRQAIIFVIRFALYAFYCIKKMVFVNPFQKNRFYTIDFFAFLYNIIPFFRHTKREYRILQKIPYSLSYALFFY